MCAMPYHDSNIFIRLMQVLNLSNPKSKWNWIEPIQKHGTHLPCQTIATHAYKDEGFLNFVASIPEQFIQVWLFLLTPIDVALLLFDAEKDIHPPTVFFTSIPLDTRECRVTSWVWFTGAWCGQCFHQSIASPCCRRVLRQDCLDEHTAGNDSQRELHRAALSLSVKRSEE